MKIKIDFVTNSSSACYVLYKKYLNDGQMFLIRHHGNVAEKIMGEQYYDQPWLIEEDTETITLSTTMDNFDMSHFLQQIGVDMNRVDYEHS